MTWEMLQSPSLKERDLRSLIGGVRRRRADPRRHGGPPAGSDARQALVLRLGDDGDQRRRRRQHGRGAGREAGQLRQAVPDRRTQDHRRRRQRTAVRRAGRADHEVVDEHPRLLEPSGGDRGDDPGRLAAHRRHRRDRRGRLPLHPRPQEGHGAARRREHLLRRDRAGRVPAPRRLRGRGLRRPRRPAGRGAGGGRRAQGRRRSRTRPMCGPTSASIWRASRCRATSGSRREQLPRGATEKIHKRTLRDQVLREAPEFHP